MPELEIGGIQVRAVSVGGLETCIELPQWRLCFDIGRSPPSAVRWPKVLFTHAHLDHMGAVVLHCATRDLFGMKPPTYYVPAENYEDVVDLFRVWRRLDKSDLTCEIVPVAPGDRIELGRGRHARVFRAIHRVPTLGYAPVAEKRKLLPEFSGLDGREIGRMRAAGEAIDEVRESVEVAFCGDTVIDVVDREPLVQAARLLILEVTFLDERVSVDRARKNGHVHLDEVIARADRLTNEHFLFTHGSLRYSGHQLQALLDARLPASLRRRAHVLLPEPPWSETPDGEPR